MYQVNEIFSSVQGEGVHSGVPATFIRLQGCPVGCEWCDTKYTWGAGGEKMTANQIIDKCVEQHVVITGGEPMLYHLDDLIKGLHQRRFYTQMETSGYTWYRGIERVKWLTWSPKPALDYKASRELYYSVREVKFVVTPDLTADIVRSVWSTLVDAGTYAYLTLMPEGCPPTQETLAKALEILYASRDIHRNVKCLDMWRVSDRLQWRFGVK